MSGVYKHARCLMLHFSDNENYKPRIKSSLPSANFVSLSCIKQVMALLSVGPHAGDLCFETPRPALGQCSPVFSAYQGLSPGVKRMEHEAAMRLHPLLRSRMSAAIYVHCPIRFRGVYRENATFYLPERVVWFTFYLIKRPTITVNM
jgi:hypothetical protein